MRGKQAVAGAARMAPVGQTRATAVGSVALLARTAVAGWVRLVAALHPVVSDK